LLVISHERRKPRLRRFGFFGKNQPFGLQKPISLNLPVWDAAIVITFQNSFTSGILFLRRKMIGKWIFLPRSDEEDASSAVRDRRFVFM